jgi:hypothetical protein
MRRGHALRAALWKKIIEKQDHPAREALIWNNLFFGPSRRKVVKMRADWEAGNSPFFLYLEINDEVVKYVNVPKDIVAGVRQFAKQKAAERAKADRAAKKSVKSAITESGNTG